MGMQVKRLRQFTPRNVYTVIKATRGGNSVNLPFLDSELAGETAAELKRRGFEVDVSAQRRFFTNSESAIEIAEQFTKAG